jgi:hypothetical protein
MRCMHCGGEFEPKVYWMRFAAMCSGRSFIARRPAGDVSWSGITAAVTASNKTRI